MAWGRQNDDMDNLFNGKIKSMGEKFPKKHGEWYRVHAYDNKWLVLDTWNQQVYLYKGECKADNTNMYRVVYGFSGKMKNVERHMRGYWMSHINANNKWL